MPEQPARRAAPRLEPPRLDWPDRDPDRVVLIDEDGAAERRPAGELPKPELIEIARHGDGAGLLLWADNHFGLDWLLRRGTTVDLIYTDPPFNTGRRFEHYDDRLEVGLYLSLLETRLVQMRDLLSARGTLVIHLDDRVVHHVRLLLDELFGPENFRNSVVVKRITKNLQHQFQQVQALPVAHDLMLVYSRDPSRRYPKPLVPKPNGPAHPEGYWKDFWSTADRPTMRYELLGITPAKGQWKWRRSRAEQAVANYLEFTASGHDRLLDWWRRDETREFVRRRGEKVYHWVPPSDTRFADTLWDEFCAYSFRRDFPTEKSEPLLERVIRLYSEPGDTVLDPFAGSGTTGAMAARLGRRWVLIERGEQALTHIAPRPAEAGAGYRLCRAQGELGTLAAR